MNVDDDDGRRSLRYAYAILAATVASDRGEQADDSAILFIHWLTLNHEPHDVAMVVAALAGLAAGDFETVMELADRDPLEALQEILMERAVESTWGGEEAAR